MIQQDIKHFQMVDTPLEDIPKIHKTLRETFTSHKTLPIPYRQHLLLQLARMLQENHKAFSSAIHADVGKPPFEVYIGEINPMIDRAIISARRRSYEGHVDLPEPQKAWKPKVVPTPKGAVLVISPWNYPLILSIQATIGAIAAGCTVCLKLSEQLLPKYLDQDVIRVVCGGVPEVTKVLEWKWDHIFYTGNGMIARIIAAAAAKHLTPLTLELGGKSPVIVDPKCDLELAAKRTLWGKVTNWGQICVSPDYVLISPSALPQYVDGLKKAYEEMYPADQGAALGSDSYAHIINLQHFNRIKGVLLEKTKGKVLMGGRMDEERLKIEPTVILVKEGDVLLESETFGPILTIVELEEEGFIRKACDWVSERDHPLVLYLFSTDEQIQDEVRRHTTSRGLVFNDTFMQLDVKVLPFGGVGESGYGRQILENTFECFSYERSTVDIPAAAEEKIILRYPPYTDHSFKVECEPGLNVKIPESTPEGGLQV
ncbi:hypothetical protein GYMLUDRAFT_50318 [Collybiopsis luxurians FD-317 M1]|uniref:Aldehyde dehydrogenase n=1 Tax=Collybiopsis luxurians FD-317 M1 TaxID=944289 RepID=A0A0D0BQ71_9AGAR|nr:hypothetical protein GYMLUDRAFT_50318 [Collybiopsis luxurians FD-317 M1]